MLTPIVTTIRTKVYCRNPKKTFEQLSVNIIFFTQKFLYGLVMQASYCVKFTFPYEGKHCGHILNFLGGLQILESKHLTLRANRNKDL